MRINLFRIVMTYKKNEVNFDLNDFFMKIHNLPKNQKLRKTCKNYPVLLKYQRDLYSGKIAFSFYKYREDYKPYTENESGELRQIEDKLIELTNCCLDHNYNFISIQYLHEGLKYKDIERYLNSFIIEKDFEIKIVKVFENFEFEEIIASDRILSIDPIFKNIPSPNGQIDSGFFTSLSRYFFENQEKSPLLKISILNNERGGSLSGNSLREFVELLETDEISHFIQDIFVTYKDISGTHTKNINELKTQISMDILKEDKNPAWAQIFVALDENYNYLQNKGLRFLDQFTEIMDVFPNEVNFELKCRPSESEIVE